MTFHRSDFDMHDIPEVPRDPGGWRDDPPSIPGADLWRPVSALEGLPIPPRQWLVKGLIPSKTVTLLGGDGGVGKSLASLQLAFSVATGGRWFNRDVAGGVACYLSAEDDEDELHRRLDAISLANGVPLRDVGDLMVRSLAGRDALLATLSGKTGSLTPSKLFTEIDAYVTRTALPCWFWTRWQISTPETKTIVRKRGSLWGCCAASPSGMNARWCSSRIRA